MLESQRSQQDAGDWSLGKGGGGDGRGAGHLVGVSYIEQIQIVFITIFFSFHI